MGMRISYRKSFVFTAVLALTAGLLMTVATARPAAAYPTGFTSDKLAANTCGGQVDVAAAGEYVHTVRTLPSGTLYYTRLSHYGDTVDFSTRLDLSGTFAETAPCIGAKTDGSVVVAYISKDPVEEGAPNYNQLCLRGSADFGATWTAGYSARTNDAHNHANSRIGQADNGSLLLTYEDYASGHSEVYFREITASGFGGQIAASEIDATADRNPSICGFAANDYVVAYDEGDGTQNSIQVARYQSGVWTFRWELNAAAANHNYVKPDIVTFAGDRLCCLYSDEPGTNSYVYERLFVQGAWSLRTSQYNATGIPIAAARACHVASGTPLKACRAGSGAHVMSIGGTDSILMSNVTPFASSRTLAWASDGSRSYIAVASNDGANGKVFVKRNDTAPPSAGVALNGVASAQGGASFYANNTPFALSFTDVADDWNVTGIGPNTTDAVTNGVTAIQLKYAALPDADPGDWYDLPTDLGAFLMADAPWTCNVDTTLIDEGAFYIKGTVSDTAGNTFDAVSGRVVVDKTDPDTSLNATGTAGTNGWLRSTASCMLVPGDENPGVTDYKLENLGTGQKDANWTRYAKAFTLPNGQWKVYYRSTDLAGNQEEVKSSVVKVDTVKPKAFITRPSKDTIQTGYYTDESFRIAGTGTDTNPLAWASIWVDGVKKYETTSGFSMAYMWKLAGVAEGDHAVTVRVKDAAGNIGQSTKNVFVGNVARDWYFAEGNSLPEFDEWLCVLNPGDQAARYQLSFMLETGEVKTFERSMAPKQRDTVKVKDYIGDPHTGVSVKIHSDNQAVVAERPMYFVYKSDNPSYMWKGGHNVLGINTLQKEWYFAEGTTRFNDADSNQFEEWLCLQNPSDNQTATAVITYMLGSGQNVDRVYQIGPHSRKTVEVAMDIGKNQDVSVKVLSDIPIAAERPMYFNYHGFAVDGSNVVGATGPSTTWSFAEGCTRAGFQEWLTVQNPSDVPAECSITYLTGAGKTTKVNRTIPARARETVDVLNNVGDNQDVSINMSSDVPVIAERPMYYIYGMDGGKNWNGGDCVLGNPAPSTTYFLAEGTTISNFDTYYTLMNPRGDTSCNVAVEYMFGDGTTQRAEYNIGPNQRITINVRDAIAREANVSGSITAAYPIVIERPMYFDYGRGITGGHDVSGYGVD